MDEIAKGMIDQINDRSISVRRRIKMILWIESYLRNLIDEVIDETE